MPIDIPWPEMSAPSGSLCASTEPSPSRAAPGCLFRQPNDSGAGIEAPEGKTGISDDRVEFLNKEIYNSDNNFIF